MIDNKSTSILNYSQNTINDFNNEFPTTPTATILDSINSPSFYTYTPLNNNHNQQQNMIDMMRPQSPTPNQALTQILQNTKTSLKMPECNSCLGLINDRYYLLVMNRAWHINCLRCTECKICLDTQMSCFTKDGFIYCKDDYIKRFPRKCQGCCLTIQPNELVMRSRNTIYHRSCFKCVICDKQLNTGDEYGILNGLIHCRLHYFTNLNDDTIKYEPFTLNISPFSPTNVFVDMDQQSHVYQQQQQHQQQAQFDSNNIFACNMPPTPNYSPPSSSTSSTSSITKQQQQQQDTNTNTSTQKGRPKKRKIVDKSNDGITKSTTSSTPNKKRQQQQQTQQQQHTVIDEAADADFKDLTHRLDYFSDDNSLTATDLDQSCLGSLNKSGLYDSPSSAVSAAAAAAAAAARQKRMRTSFKHHQLRVMKSYFELNHNPDAKDLKQLSQKTGLSKRVLQVWFQNARAKYRRNQSNMDQNSNNNNNTTSNGNTPTNTNSLILQHLTTNNNELGIHMDDMSRHQIYHQNSTTDTSSLNDLDLMVTDVDDDIDDSDIDDDFHNNDHLDTNNDENNNNTDEHFNSNNKKYKTHHNHRLLHNTSNDDDLLLH